MILLSHQRKDKNKKEVQSNEVRIFHPKETRRTHTEKGLVPVKGRDP